MNDVHPLAALALERAAGRTHGITSVCSAHPLVIEAALLQAEADGTPALIEATCNQVNQEGGYTGMTPADFRDMVFAIADRVGLARDRIILGGDHLGPNPWKDLEAEEAVVWTAASNLQMAQEDRVGRPQGVFTASFVEGVVDRFIEAFAIDVEGEQ